MTKLELKRAMDAAAKAMLDAHDRANESSRVHQQNLALLRAAIEVDKAAQQAYEAAPPDPEPATEGAIEPSAGQGAP